MFKTLSINPAIIISGFVILAGFTIFLIHYFSTKQSIIRILSKLPNKPVRSLKTNHFTKISGEALHVKEPLIAPLSKRKCIFYCIKIEQKKSTGKNNYWKTLINEEKVQPFFLNANGDFAIVTPTENPKNYISHLVVDKNATSGTFNEASPEFISLLRTYNINNKGFFGFNKRLRYKEGIIEIGEQITVAGIATWKTLNEPLPDYPYSKIAALKSSDKQKLIITDLPQVRVTKRRM